MAQSKSTKKFEKHHLTDTLKRRKDFAKVKQRHQVNAKKKAKRAKTEGDRDVSEEPEAEKVEKPKNALAEMSVDEFFAGGLEAANVEPKKRSGKRRRDETNGDDQQPAVASVEEHAALEASGSEEDEDDELDTHKGDLKALADKDPEFYKYLQENDAELLDFAEDSNLSEVDDLSADEMPETKGQVKKSKKKDMEIETTNDVSHAMVKRWTSAIVDKHSLRAMREIVLAFRAAAHLNEENGKEYKYTISNAEVYHELLLSALKHIPNVLSHHMPVTDLQSGKIRVSTEAKKFSNLTSLLKSHALSIQHLLENLSDVGTTKLTLTSLLSLLPYLLSFKKLIRNVSRTVVDIWSDPAQNEAIRISAFLVLRRLTVIGDPGIKETILRNAYQGLLKGGRNTTIHNIAGINLMKNSGAELWGLANESNVAYTTGFTFTRSLAIHLRNSIKNNSNDAYKAVYNWQYVHALDFWSRVLSMHCESLREATSGKESPLRPLIYPLTQITLGALRLIPTAAYFPLRFQLTRSLLRLSSSTNTYIPLAAPLHEVLTSSELRRGPRPSTLKPLDFETSIRASKNYLRTRVYQDGVGEQVLELLADFFVLWARSIAFPELALPVVVMLKRWLKEVSPYTSAAATPPARHYKKGKLVKKNAAAGGNRNAKLNGAVALLVQKLDANARFVEEKRARVEFAPRDRAGVEAFLKELEWNKTPLGAFVEGQRRSREERRRVLEESRAQDKRGRKEDGDGEREGGGGGYVDVSDDESEVGNEMEMEMDEEDDVMMLES